MRFSCTAELSHYDFIFWLKYACVFACARGAQVRVCVFFIHLFSMLHYKVILHAFVSNFNSTVIFTLLYIPSFPTVTTIELSACDLYN